MTYLFFAYSAIWIVLFLYGFTLWRKQDRIEKGLKKLQERQRA